MGKKKKISNEMDLEERLLALKLENELLLRHMKTDVTSVKTYLPPAALTDSFTMNSFSGITEQISKQGLTLGIVLPLILNNTVLKGKSKVVKTLVTSLSLLVGSNIPIQDVPKAIKKLFNGKKKKKKNDIALIDEQEPVSTFI